jgi:hypothetical protein
MNRVYVNTTYNLMNRVYDNTPYNLMNRVYDNTTYNLMNRAYDNTTYNLITLCLKNIGDEFQVFFQCENDVISDFRKKNSYLVIIVKS